MGLDPVIDKMKDEIIASTQNIVRIKSVKGEAKPGMPFGQGVNEALEYVLDLGDKMGLRTKNVDGYAGYVEWGEGEELVGILCHLDVVPEGTGWQYPPYDAQIHEGKLYGRGILDDKGPGIAVLYALKAIKDADVPLNKRIRIIFGTDEESSWGGIKYYLDHEEKPCCGFTPDADFPIINSEKGILTCTLAQSFVMGSKDGEMVIHRIQGGSRPNMVPDFCLAEVQVQDPGAFKQKYYRIKEEKGFSLDIEEKEDNMFTIKSTGISAHGSTPEKGKNAIMNLVQLLNYFDISASASASFVRFLAEYIGGHCDGRGFDMALKDDISGVLTLNVGMIDINEHEGNAVLNIRYPISFSEEEIISRMERKIQPASIMLQDVRNQPPLYVSPENELIKKLQYIYSLMMGEEAELISIGGGTYARAIDNAVAFGPLFPGQPSLAHEPNECMALDDLIGITKIYMYTMIELGK